MHPHTRNHYRRVAKAMYNYAATPSYMDYPMYDRMAMGVYPNANFGDRFATGLYSVGLSNGFSYRVGQFINGLL